MTSPPESIHLPRIEKTPGSTKSQIHRMQTKEYRYVEITLPTVCQPMLRGPASVPRTMKGVD
jgi:hypothetical protein